MLTEHTLRENLACALYRFHECGTNWEKADLVMLSHYRGMAESILNRMPEKERFENKEIRYEQTSR